MNGFYRVVTLSSLLWLVTSATSATRADAAFDVRCQYVRYARAFNSGDLPALGALSTPGCSIVENYGAKPWPLLSDIRLYRARYHQWSLFLSVNFIRLRANNAAVLVSETYTPPRRGGGFRRERRDVWERGPAGWRLKSVQILDAGGLPNA